MQGGYMDIVKEKNWIKKEVDTIDDEQIILTLKKLIDYAHAKQEHLRPFSVKELKERALQSELDIQNGNVISLEDLLKTSANL